MTVANFIVFSFYHLGYNDIAGIEGGECKSEMETYIPCQVPDALPRTDTKVVQLFGRTHQLPTRLLKLLSPRLVLSNHNSVSRRIGRETRLRQLPLCKIRIE